MMFHLNGPKGILRVAVAALCLLVCSSALAHIPIFGADEEKPSLAPLLEQTKNAVVNISVTTRENRVSLFDDWGRLRPRQTYRDVQAAGSGVIIDAANGLVVTNHHVIEQARRVVITLQDRRAFDAKFIGSDDQTDIALLQIEAEGLTDLTLANSDLLRVGDFVIAIGNPFGLGQTVTTGIVSALGRNELDIVSAEDFIQTDASINPGNSGGALIDLEGNLVGINTAIISPATGGSGIGFAIPTNMVQIIANQLIEYGDIRRGSFGLQIAPITADLVKVLELPTSAGVVVTEVFPGSGASQANMQINDVIIAFNGKPITNNADLVTSIALLRIGQKFELTVIRSGKQMQIEGVVQEYQRDDELVSGVFVDDIPANHPYYGRIRGIVVSAIDGRENTSRLMEGDIILEINRVGIRSMKDLANVDLSQRPLALRVVRGTQEIILLIR